MEYSTATPASPSDQAAALIERVVKNAPFQHGSAAHPQFLNDVKVVISAPEVIQHGQHKPMEQNLVLNVYDPHIKNIPGEVGHFVAQQLATIPALAAHLEFTKAEPANGKGAVHIHKENDKDSADGLRIIMHLPPDFSAAQAIAGINALDGVLPAPATNAPSPLQFATVDSINIVGAHTEEAKKAAAELLQKFSALAAPAPNAAHHTEACDAAANALTPFAEQLVAYVEAAHQAIETAKKTAAGVPLPSVQVNSISIPPQGQALAH